MSRSSARLGVEWQRFKAQRLRTLVGFAKVPANPRNQVPSHGCSLRRKSWPRSACRARPVSQQSNDKLIKQVQFTLPRQSVQYAPQLLSTVKLIVDRGVPPGGIWLTGSLNFEVMTGVRETLAGRVGILNLLGLSHEEKGKPTSTPKEYFAHLCETTFPKLAGVSDISARDLCLSSYVQTYIERDVCELIGIQKRREFEVFVKMCALRTAQEVNLQNLARDAGISPPTAKEWLSLLEDSFLLRLVHPYHTNRTKRLVKSPKLYFLDAGLAAWLGGWRDAEALRLGPMAGALFETHIFGEILRRYRHRAREVEITFWRTRDGEEIDFLVEAGGSVFPVEAKMGLPGGTDLPKLERIRENNWKDGTVLTLTTNETRTALTGQWQMAAATSLGFLPV